MCGSHLHSNHRFLNCPISSNFSAIQCGSSLEPFKLGPAVLHTSYRCDSYHLRSTDNSKVHPAVFHMWPHKPTLVMNV